MAEYEGFPGIHLEGWPFAWVALVAKLVSPGRAIEAAEKLKELVPALLKKYPYECFNQTSAMDLAEKVSGVPNLKSMSAVLAKWKEALRPPSAVPAIASPEDWRAKNTPPPPTRDDLARDWGENPGRIRQHVYEIQDRMEAAATGRGRQVGGPLAVVEVEAQMARLLTCCVMRHAPQHAGLLPPEWIERHRKVAEKAR